LVGASSGDHHSSFVLVDASVDVIVEEEEEGLEEEEGAVAEE
jgi:hypothetical protein